MWEFETEVSEVRQRTPSIKSFRFPRSPEATYEAGQFFFVTIKVGGADAVHHFSFSSSPTEKDYIEFTKRITASDYSRTLNSIRPGAWAKLRGPAGTFVLPENPQELAFVSGGIGITPLRSMLRYIYDRQLVFNVVLLYASNTFEELAFREELDEIANTLPGFRREYVLSDPDAPPEWPGKTGHIDKDLIRQLIPDYDRHLYYVSGPPKMVMSLTDQLKELGLSPNQVKRDSFTGYD